MDVPFPSREDIDSRGRRIWNVGSAIVYEARAENLPFMAGSLAYHAFVSLLPLLVLLLFALQSVADAALSDRVFGIVEAVLTPTGRDLVADAVSAENPSRGMSLLGAGVLLWATLRIFRGLDQAFSDVYESEHHNSLLDQLVDGVVVLLTVVGAVVLAGLARTILDFDGSTLGQIFQVLFVVVGLTASLFPMFYVFPDRDVSVRGVLPGTVLAACGITVLESLFRLYVEVGGASRGYGVLGAILVLLTWLYFVGLVILLGAVVNAVLTNHTEDVDIEPVIGDHRPGIGRTFGRSLWHSPERDVVTTRLETLVEQLGDDKPLVFDVGGVEIRLPPPETIDVDHEDGDAVGIEFRW